jgi:hypothetical protein
MYANGHEWEKRDANCTKQAEPASKDEEEENGRKERREHKAGVKAGVANCVWPPEEIINLPA